MIKTKLAKILIAAAMLPSIAVLAANTLRPEEISVATNADDTAVEPISEILPADENISGESHTDIVEAAQAWCDTYSPYLYGASGSDGPGSAVDCSAFTKSVYDELGIEIPRVSYDQAKIGTEVAYTPGDYSNLLPGDLVIMNNYGHCGIYAGNGMVIHASSAGGRVIKVPMNNFSSGFVNEVRRVIYNGG